jgi:hypothetical protein
VWLSAGAASQWCSWLARISRRLLLTGATHCATALLYTRPRPAKRIYVCVYINFVTRQTKVVTNNCKIFASTLENTPREDADYVDEREADEMQQQNSNTGEVHFGSGTLPDNWAEARAPGSGKTYYWNMVTKETRWLELAPSVCAWQALLVLRQRAPWFHILQWLRPRGRWLTHGQRWRWLR